MRRFSTRLISILVSVALIAGVLSLYSNTIYAEGEPITSDTSWYSDGATTYSIATAGQLLGLSELVNAGNTFEDKTIAIVADIDLQSIAWTPIGASQTTPFMGIVNGATTEICQISNLNVSSSNKYAGLFGYTVGASFAKLSISGVVNSSTGGSSGSIAGYAYISISVTNCVSNCNVSGVNAGGIVGCCYDDEDSASSFVFCNCVNNGSVYGSTTAGILGIAKCLKGLVDVSFTNCTNTGYIMSNQTSVINKDSNSAGGIIGFIEYKLNGCNLNISNCTNQGQITASERAGGILGSLYSGYDAFSGNVMIQDCNNQGIILSQATEHSATGGVVGKINSAGSTNNRVFKIIDCENSGNVSGVQNVGGIIGHCYFYSGITIGSCSNSGSISGSIIGVGGIIGTINTSHGTFSELSNSGTVSGQDFTSGIFGQVSSSSSSYSYLSNEGSIIGTTSVGGIIGGFSNCMKDAMSYLSNTANVSGVGSVGGLIGVTSASYDGMDVSYSYSTSQTITGSGNDVGGLIGNAYYVDMSDCYCISNVSGSSNVGGIVGTAVQVDFSSCYFAGNTLAASYCAAIVGNNVSGVSSTYTNVYYSLDYSTTSPVGLSGIVGLSDSDMTGNSALARLTGFDASTWVTTPNTNTQWFYPHLSGFTNTPYILVPYISNPIADSIVNVEAGENITLGITSENASSFLWQSSNDNGLTWIDLSSSSDSSLTISPSLSDDGLYYRCIASSADGRKTSTSANTILNVEITPVFTIPNSEITINVIEGEDVSLEANASNTVSYSWQRNDGTGWITVGTNSSTLDLSSISLSENNTTYRCVATSTTNTVAISNSFNIYVSRRVVMPSFVNSTDTTITINENSNTVLSVSANNVSNYQWQVNRGNGWTDIYGANSYNYQTENLVFADNGIEFRCCVNSSTNDSALSGVFTVNVLQSAAVTPTVVSSASPAPTDTIVVVPGAVNADTSAQEPSQSASSQDVTSAIISTVSATGSLGMNCVTFVAIAFLILAFVLMNTVNYRKQNEQ